MMRMRKFIASDRFYVVQGHEAKIMQQCMKKCEAYRTRTGDLKVKGSWGHLVDVARYPVWYVTRKLAEVGDQDQLLSLPVGIGKARRLGGR
jgi:hypothetical protein